MSLFLQSYSFNTKSTLPGPVALIILVAALIAVIFYLITLQNTLKAVAPENRKMEPGMVWLMFIPLFNIVWHFIIVNRMADSIQAQLNKSGEPTHERPAHSIGMAMCILGCCGIIPLIGIFINLAGLICWIIYWVKISEFKRKIESLPIMMDPDSEIFGAKQY